MQEKDELTKLFKLVNMNEVAVSNDEMPIVGTQALATCVGVLIYSEKYKCALVAHVGTEWQNLLESIFELLIKNELDSAPLEYLIIPGYYYNHYEVVENLSAIFADLYPLFVPMQVSLDNGVYIKDPKLPAHQFAFDARTKKFVTNQVLFGKEYFDVQSNLKK
ncbi:MAG: hypothetical protein E7164_04525 [Firmicutes bacterium]|nr:hypothetical protein [Bacillota bacterium]